MHLVEEADNRPLVSVALCTFNGARHLEQQLESLEQQTTPPLEVVVGDDGSTDETWALLHRHAQHSRINFRFLEGTAGGPTENFGRVMSVCSGDIIMPCDQDDIWHSDKIATMVEAFDDDTQLVLCDANLVRESGAPMDQTLWQAIGFRTKDQIAVLEAKYVDAFVRRTIAFGLTMALRREVVRWACPVPMPFGHDNFAALIAGATGRVRLTQRPLVEYRQHSAQVSGIRSRPHFARAPKNAGIRATATSFALCADRMNQIPLEKRGSQFVGLRHAVIEKAEHLRNRETLPDKIFHRALVVGKETLGGRYTRYSNGWRSAAKDLVFGCL